MRILVLVLLASCASADNYIYCPSAPADATLDPVAPYFGGGAFLRTKALDPGARLEIELFDHGKGLWAEWFGDVYTAEDGTHVEIVDLPSQRQAGPDAIARFRVRLAFDGCPSTKWVSVADATVRDPLVDTTWETTVATNESSLEVSDTISTHLLTVPTLTHTISFAANGTTEERFRFTLKAADATKAFHDCTIDLSYAGTWKGSTSSDGDYGLELGIASPITAKNLSTCALVDPTTFRFSALPATATLPVRSNDSLFIDYSPAFDATPGAPILRESFFLNATGHVSAHLSTSGLSVSAGLSANGTASYTR